ncbi:MAG: hypothetical protein GOVbin4162_14 [Prokaryotic dsDNA virus sp.]|nr:MAG: hypothetical protein GOVbin4162_14 [Prokaryotic dsDNA virus sp.]
MCRCRACNRELDLETLVAHKPDGSLEDLCSVCRNKSNSEYNILFDHEYGQSSITGDAPTPSSNYYYELHD